MRAGAARTSGGDPGLADGEAGGDQAGAIGAHPGHEIGMTEARALPGPLDMSIEPDAHYPPGHLVGEFRIVAGGDPHAADRQAGHFGDTENAILPERRG